MNEKRRNKIKVIRKNLEQIAEQIGEVLEEEQESRDNIPESFEEKIEELDYNCDILEDAYSGIDGVISYLEEL